MAVSVQTPLYPDYGDQRWIKPNVETLNPRNAEQLIKILDYAWKEGAEVTLDLSQVKIMTNLAARMLCKTLYGRQSIMIENSNSVVQSSLEWAADYLYEKGELDDEPWQISNLSL
jgi:hypothetical protein